MLIFGATASDSLAALTKDSPTPAAIGQALHDIAVHSHRPGARRLVLEPFESAAGSLCRFRSLLERRGLVYLGEPILNADHLVRLSAVRTIDFRQV